MQRYLAFLLLLVLVPILWAQVLMVRCDNGNSKDFLGSADQLNFSALQSGFDPNVDTIVMIHGFKNDFDGCKGSYTTTANIIKAQVGKRNFVGFHWPSNFLIDFGAAIKNADQCHPYLIRTLNEIMRLYGTSTKRIHAMTHSLGARVLLSTLSQNEARYIRWGNCYTMAAAVHNDAFSTSFSGTNEVAQKVYVFHSERDGVLKYIYALYYMLFDRGVSENISMDMAQFQQLTIDEQIEYLRQLDEAMQQNRDLNLSEFDLYLANALMESSRTAMGLNGSTAANRVENVNMQDIVDSHTYWENTAAIQRIAGKM